MLLQNEVLVYEDIFLVYKVKVLLNNEELLYKLKYYYNE